MIRVSRICAEAFKASIFSGEGAYIKGGRWNSPGNRVVYTAQSLSLATLELLVHLDARQIGDNFVCANAVFPEEIVMEVLTTQDRFKLASSDDFREIGDRWISESSSAVLHVPSIIVAREYNYLLNPNHPDFAKISFQETEPFRFDLRLLKS